MLTCASCYMFISHSNRIGSTIMMALCTTPFGNTSYFHRLYIPPTAVGLDENIGTTHRSMRFRSFSYPIFAHPPNPKIFNPFMIAHRSIKHRNLLMNLARRCGTSADARKVSTRTPLPSCPQRYSTNRPPRRKLLENRTR